VGIPLGHLVWMGGLSDFVFLFVFGGLLYIMGAIIYATRIPERYYPGVFDYWFHSHSLFHLFIVGAAFVHFKALLDLFEWRLKNPCN